MNVRFEIREDDLKDGLTLDLGQVLVAAEVFVNDQSVTTVSGSSPNNHAPGTGPQGHRER